MSHNETHADILDEFRKFALRAAEEDNMISPESVLLLADKVEAAAQREKAEAVTIAATKAVNLTDEKWRRDTGNIAAMRKALEELVKFTCDSCNERFCEDDVEEEDGIRYCSPCNTILKARAALAAPARNCDRYATWKDAWDAFTAAYFGPTDPGEMEYSFGVWLFAPAKEARDE